MNLRNEHNHSASGADAMVRRDVSRETIEKLKTLFESGHSASSALNQLKYDLQEKEQDNYVHAAADRSVCPDLQFCYRSVLNPVNYICPTFNLPLKDNFSISIKRYISH